MHRVKIAALIAVPVLLLLIVAGRLWIKPRIHIPAQQKEDRVVDLPGQPPVNFQHYAGYVTVEGKANAGKHSFYWFFEAEEGPLEKPVVLWLNGGPGASSIGLGEAMELGPFLVTKDKMVLAHNKHSWNKAANLLFLESPIGVGFSYSDGCNESDLSNQTDVTTARLSYNFLLQWFERFPQFKGNEFYMAGESYAGHYVPQLASLILDKGNGINFKGILLGNPLLDDESWNRGFVDSAYHSSIIADKNTTADAVIYNTLPNLIDIYNIYEDPCFVDEPPVSENSTVGVAPVTTPNPRSLRRLMLKGYDPCLMNYANNYFNRRVVQYALHARLDKICNGWNVVSFYINPDTYNSNITSVLDTLKMIVDAKLRVWIYSGDNDAMVPVTVTRYDMDKLYIGIKEPWSPWFRNKIQVGGWKIIYDGLTFLTVRGAGHMVPTSKPKEALHIFKSFLANTKL